MDWDHCRLVVKIERRVCRQVSVGKDGRDGCRTRRKKGERSRLGFSALNGLVLGWRRRMVEFRKSCRESEKRRLLQKGDHDGGAEEKQIQCPSDIREVALARKMAKRARRVFDAMS